jgi:predicted Rossmann fold nucleotide-binding protein DprA/Smf involved in DNA uptake
MTEAQKAYENEIRADERQKSAKEIANVIKTLATVGSKLLALLPAECPIPSAPGPKVNRAKVDPEDARQHEDKVLYYLQDGDVLTATSIAKLVNLDGPVVSAALLRLQKAGKVVSTGERRAKVWTRAPRPAEPNGTDTNEYPAEPESED